MADERDDEQLEPEPRPDPRALPNPGGLRIYSVDQGGASSKPYRPLHVLTKDRRVVPTGMETRAPFLPGVTQHLPVQTAEEQIATVRADVAGRVQELEEMLDNQELVEVTRGAVVAEIARLRQLEP